MGQEYFGGPEYFQEFDPEKFARDIIAQAQAEKDAAAKEKPEPDDAGEDPEDQDA